ncbi:MAG: DUF4347 domain-containing protein, partial [Cyanobacteriota bacterium]|nr:DUF4347 domain-containing protein [Cyanobacteriota bacterium]
MNITQERGNRFVEKAIEVACINYEVNQQIVFIDAGVEDYQTLAAGVVAGIEVVILDATKDGIRQITQALQDRGKVFSIHLVSHGSPGCLQLGSSKLNLDTINDRAAELTTWSA